MSKKYYQLAQTEQTADLTIYGDITSWRWMESDVSAYSLAQELDALDVDTINVYINSYGGEVAEGLAIYNALRRHKAKIRTVCDGFACSAASVIFMAGDERIMNAASLLMIHNAWSYASGNAEALRKQADDLDTITQGSINAYMAHVNISEEEVKELMDKESWILPSDAVSWGFATAITEEEENNNPSQSARQLVFAKIAEQRKELSAESVAKELFLLMNTPQKPTPTPKPEQSLMQTMAGFFNAQK